MYYIYVLFSKSTGKLYKGFTHDLKIRFIQHNNKRVTSTKSGSGVPWKLVYYEAFVNKTDALREEKFLKSGKGKERLKFLLENTVTKLKGEVG